MTDEDISMPIFSLHIHFHTGECHPHRYIHVHTQIHDTQKALVKMGAIDHLARESEDFPSGCYFSVSSKHHFLSVS